MASGQTDMSGGVGAEGSGRTRRRVVTLLAWVVTLLVAVIVVGALFPPIRLIAVIGTSSRRFSRCMFSSPG